MSAYTQLLTALANIRLKVVAARNAPTKERAVELIEELDAEIEALSELQERWRDDVLTHY